jgi:hypothetical protein
MKKISLIAGVASLVALAIVAIALAASSGGDNSSDSSGEDPGLAAGSCPAADVPGISNEERERCFGADSGGNGATPLEEPTVSPNQPVSSTPGGSVTIGTSKLPGLPADRRAVEAPIDGLDIAVLESFPPQYMLTVHAGLPSGCAQRYGSEIARYGDVITVTVLNSMPAIQNMACTMIYGTYEVNLNLGGDFEPGVTYTVQVNDQETTFTAQ